MSEAVGGAGQRLPLALPEIVGGLVLLVLLLRMVVNLSVLKNGRAKAIRFSTLTAICRELDCGPGDLLSIREE